MNKIVIALSLISLVTGGCFNGQKLSDTDNKVISIMKGLTEENGLPGMNVSLILEDGVQKSYSVGYADIDEEILLNTGHVLFSGSVGKTYLVGIMMQLIDKGEINFQDRFIDYFPEVEWLDSLPNINEISVENLLQHTTGLPRYVMKPAIWDSLSSNPDKIWTYRDRLFCIFNDSPVRITSIKNIIFFIFFCPFFSLFFVFFCQ